MALYVVATPIGDPEDITLRARKILETADIIIGEEAKEARRLLKQLNIQWQQLEILNEHSQETDLIELAKLCSEKTVALISDCGTPGFEDPGAHLVKACRKISIPIYSIPGPSSLTAFLSVCGFELHSFFFRGFLPAKNELREQAWQNLKSYKDPIIVMDTPYRLGKMIEELGRYFGENTCAIGLNLSFPKEQIIIAKGRELKKKISQEKAEFMALIMPLRQK